MEHFGVIKGGQMIGQDMRLNDGGDLKVRTVKEENLKGRICKNDEECKSKHCSGSCDLNIGR